jgi:hypothetical protein
MISAVNSLKKCFVFLITLWLAIGSELSARENKSYVEGEVLIQLRQQDYAVTDKRARILKALDVDVIKNLKNNVAKCHKCLFSLARPAGFEPAAYGFEVRCSIQLSYGRQGEKLFNDNISLI